VTWWDRDREEEWSRLLDRRRPEKFVVRDVETAAMAQPEEEVETQEEAAVAGVVGGLL
jgi:hypothetical protein